MQILIKACTALLLAILIALGGVQSDAMAMYGTNFSAKFKTSQGSCYDVSSSGFVRYKYDGTQGGGEGKNIYYGSREGTALAQDLYDLNKGQYTVEIIHSELGSIMYPNGRDGLNKVNIGVKPELKDYPVDMYLNASGSGIGYENDKFHIGDKITEFVEKCK